MKRCSPTRAHTRDINKNRGKTGEIARMNRRLADATGQLHQIGQEIKQKYYAMDRILLFFHYQSPLLGKLRIATKAVGQEQEIYIILMETLEKVHQIYKMTRLEWQKLVSAGASHKSCNLKDLVCITAKGGGGGDSETKILENGEKENTNATSANEMTVDMGIMPSTSFLIQPCEPELPKLFKFNVIWPHRVNPHDIFQITNLQYKLQQYMGYFCDFMLIQNPLKKINQLSRDEWLKQAECHMPHLNLIAHHFMSEFIRSTMSIGQQQPILYNRLNRHILEKWLDFSLHLFTLHEYQLSSVEECIASHIVWIEEESYNGWYHSWQDYRLPCGKLWKEQEEKGKGKNDIILSVRWLFELDLRGLVYQLNHRGGITVKKSVFEEKILPHLYRVVLKDWLHLLCYQHTTMKKSGLSWTLYNNPMDDLMREMDKGREWTVIYQYNLTTACNYESPVMRAMVRYEERQSVLQMNRNKKASSRHTKHLHETIGPIEELANYMPPCVKPLMEAESLKHYDRLNITKICYDLGYTEQEITDFFCRFDGNNRSTRSYYASHYKECLAESPQGAVNRVSKSCQTFINYAFPKGNIIRCPYESTIYKEKRQKCTEEEMSTFQSQCACKGGIKEERIFSAVDYIKCQINL
jgi:hypothetical protein